MPLKDDEISMEKQQNKQSVFHPDIVCLIFFKITFSKKTAIDIGIFSHLKIRR